MKKSELKRMIKEEYYNTPGYKISMNLDDLERAIQWANEKGDIEGYAEKYFRGVDNINRIVKQLVNILYRMKK